MSTIDESSTDNVDNKQTNPEPPEEPFVFVQRKKNNKKTSTTISTTTTTTKTPLPKPLLTSKDDQTPNLNHSTDLPGWSSRKPRKIKNNSQRAKLLGSHHQHEKSIDWGIDTINDKILTLKQSKFYEAFKDLVQLTLCPPCQTQTPIHNKPDQPKIESSSPPLQIEQSSNIEPSNCDDPQTKERDGSKDNRIIDMVFYGIGSIESSRNSQFQLALGLCLKEILQITGTISVSDPIMTDFDKKLMEKFDLFVLDPRENADKITGNRTLFYMPHCPKGLYSRVLESNWSREQLNNLVILGNRFTMYDERQKMDIVYSQILNSLSNCLGSTSFRQVARQAPFILPALFISSLTPFPQVKFEDNTIFNDLSFHCFPSDKSVPEVDTTDREDDPECL